MNNLDKYILDTTIEEHNDLIGLVGELEDIVNHDITDFIKLIKSGKLKIVKAEDKKEKISKISLCKLREYKKMIDERLKNEDSEIERCFSFSVNLWSENERSYHKMYSDTYRDTNGRLYISIRTINNKVYIKYEDGEFKEISLNDLIEVIKKYHKQMYKDKVSEIKKEILRIRRNRK